MLEYIGDIGGLFDGLTLLAAKLIAPIAAFAVKSELLSKNFTLATKGLKNEDKIKSQSYVSNLMCLYCKNSKYRIILDRNEKTLLKQLDIVNFVQQQKILLLTALSTLTTSQLLLIDKHSELLISDPDQSGSEITDDDIRQSEH